MRTVVQLSIVLLSLLFAGCQGVASPTSEDLTSESECTTRLADDIMVDAPLLDVGLVSVEEMSDVPFAGSLGGQAIVLYDEILVLSQYGAPETARILLESAIAEGTFGDGGEVLTESPVEFGDETIWVKYSDAVTTEAGIARYGDHLLMGQSHVAYNVEEMLAAFDAALLEYIAEHPQCAYLHPATRES